MPSPRSRNRSSCPAALDGVTAIDTTPLLATAKRTGLIRH